MITEEDFKQLDGVLSDIVDKQDYYLSAFGAFVKNRVCSILASRHPQLKSNALFGDKTRSLFMAEFLKFLIDNPELFARKMPYPFINILGSIKKLKARPQDYSITWISDKAFIETTKIPDRASHDSAMRLTINSIKKPIDGLNDKQRELLPEGYYWLSPNDVALAMMEDFDPESQTLRGEWLAHLKNKKSKNYKKKQAFIKSIESLLSPTMILKCMASEEPEPPELDDYNEGMITQSKWKEYVRYAIKTIFLELNCQTREEAMDCYTRIHKVLLLERERLSRTDKSLKNRLTRGITLATAKIEYIQSRFNYRINLTADEFIKAFRRGIMLQIKDISLKNPAYAFMKNHVHESMKRIKRMKLTDDEKSRYENILCHEALLIRYSNIKPYCDVFEFKKLAEEVTGSSVDALNIIEVTLLKNSVVKNNLTDPESPRNLGFGDLASDIDENKHQFSVDDLKYNPYINHIHRAKDFATKGLKRAFYGLRQHRNKQFPWFDIASNTLPKLGFFGKVTLEDRVAVIRAIMTGDNNALLKTANAIKDEVKNAQSWVTTVSRLSKINSLLCITAAAPIPDSHKKSQQDLFAALFDVFSSLDIRKHDIIAEYITTLDTLSCISIELRRDDLLKILKDNRRELSLGYSGNAFHDYRLFDDHRKSLKQALLSIKCPEERHLFSFYAISIHPCHYLAATITESIDDWIHKIDIIFESGLKALLMHYFQNNDIDPFTYLSSCPDWHQPHVMEIMS